MKPDPKLLFRICNTALKNDIPYIQYTSVPDPDSYDPYVFEPLELASGKVTGSQRYGSEDPD